MRTTTPLEKRWPHRAILLKALQKKIEIDETAIPPPLARFHHRVMAEKLLGPTWNTREWFGAECGINLAFQKRCIRAINDLEAAGLLDVFDKVVRINLTEAGWDLAWKASDENRRLRREQKKRDQLEDGPEDDDEVDFGDDLTPQPDEPQDTTPTDRPE